MLRLVVTFCFLALPLVVKAVNPLVSASSFIAAYQHALAAHITPSAELIDRLGLIKAAAAAAPGQWQAWYWICTGGIVVFLLTVFLMRGRWSPSAARADEAAHDEQVARELAAHGLDGSGRRGHHCAPFYCSS